MREDPVTDVPLHQRSSPYDFSVDVFIDSGSLRVYGGKHGNASYKNALSAYWQAVNMLRFAHVAGTVRMELTVGRNPYGGFTTEVAPIHQPGREPVLHIPDGECLNWAYRRTLGIVELMIATTPNMLRPVKHPRPQS